MNAELKAKWVQALRSGEFKQAKRRLKRGDGYCCIGVGYLVAGFGEPAEQQSTCDATSMLGIGIDDELTLIGMNDIKGKTFPEIADWIEEHL